ncbi:MAG TPA: FHA domain-containing protein, partial [Polyangia bacterium]|nr:FHA domain-containing protein [Polyangia bacterium]
AAGLRLRAAAVEKRLCRGRAINLRVPGGGWVRIAPLPTEIGRDPAAGIPLRDPAVSRRHALLRAEGDMVLLEDAGSRAGVRLGGVRLEPGAALPLRGAGQLTVGTTTTLRFQADGARLTFEGAAGLDRGLRALAGVGPVALDGVLPGTDGLTLEIVGDLARLGRRSDVAVRVDGHLIGPGCDLLHGDLIELPATGARLEVE